MWWSAVYGDGLEFEWDQRKARTNARKHGVTFEEAVESFLDVLGRIERDVSHSVLEDRWLNVGATFSGRLLVTTYTLRGRAIRFIGSRPATPRERHEHESRRRP